MSNITTRSQSVESLLARANLLHGSGLPKDYFPSPFPADMYTRASALPLQDMHRRCIRCRSYHALDHFGTELCKALGHGPMVCHSCAAKGMQRQGRGKSQAVDRPQLVESRSELEPINEEEEPEEMVDGDYEYESDSDDGEDNDGDVVTKLELSEEDLTEMEGVFSKLVTDDEMDMDDDDDVVDIKMEDPDEDEDIDMALYRYAVQKCIREAENDSIETLCRMDLVEMGVEREGQVMFT